MLIERGARLRQRSRRFASLDDDRGLGEGAHGDVAFGKEQPVLRHGLLRISKDRHLRNRQEIVGYAVLQRPIFGRIMDAERRPNDGDGATARVDRGGVCGGVDAARQPRHDGEVFFDQRARQLPRRFDGFLGGLARSDHRDTASLGQFPRTLIVQKLDSDGSRRADVWDSRLRG